MQREQRFISGKETIKLYIEFCNNRLKGFTAATEPHL